MRLLLLLVVLSGCASVTDQMKANQERLGKGLPEGCRYVGQSLEMECGFDMEDCVEVEKGVRLCGEGMKRFVNKEHRHLLSN